MAPELPMWLEYFKAFSTPIVAIIAGAIASFIAFRQWQTANEKVVLDLFQRRSEAYDQLTGAITSINQHGGVGDSGEQIGPFARGLKQAKFLFGDEVNSYLNDMWDTILRLRSVSRRLPSAADEKVNELSEREDECYSKIGRLYDDFDKLVTPYMKMDQKISRFKLMRWH